MNEAVEIEALERRTGATPAGAPALATLRFLTCGSVDDGKSTLIGRLLYEQQLILTDQLAALERDSKKHGTVGADIDFALLVDGLEAEREQGITIDVAYRAFSTRKRAFIVADTPGHEQYTRNMATGASNCDLAVLLVDCRKGLLAQTHRHATIVSLLGIRHVVLAVNKIDLVGYDQAPFEKIAGAFTAFAAPLGFATCLAIPVSARFGDNISEKSAKTPWYSGPDLVAYLEFNQRRRRPQRAALPHAGAMGEPAAPRFPRVLRDDCLGHDPAGRRARGRYLGQEHPRRAHRHGRWRS